MTIVANQGIAAKLTNTDGGTIGIGKGGVDGADIYKWVRREQVAKSVSLAGDSPNGLRFSPIGRSGGTGK